MDKEQFWKLLEPIHPKAENFCRKLCDNRDDGDDLYQEALLMAMRKVSMLKDLTAFRPWLFRIIINRFKNRTRIPWWRRQTEPSADELIPISQIDPQDQHDLRRLLKRALAVLTPEDQALIVLFEIDNWKVAELASMFKKPEGTIKARLARSRRKMRKELEKQLSKVEENGKMESAGDKFSLDKADIDGRYAEG